MEKIIINGRILRNPSHARIPPMLGFYQLALAMGCKLFPFRIPWKLLKSCRSHVDHMICPPCTRESWIRPPLGPVYYQSFSLMPSGSFGQPVILILSSLPMLMWLSMTIFTLIILIQICIPYIKSEILHCSRAIDHMCVIVSNVLLLLCVQFYINEHPLIEFEPYSLCHR